MPETRAASLKAGSLLLDPKNTRIPPDHRSNDQRILLHELIAHEDVKSLAQSISKLGLFPNERLIVTPTTGRRYIVLEGNRRLAAIRLLINPELAPNKNQVSHYRMLQGRVNLASLARLDVAIVPDRVAAAPIIAALHTREAKRRWSSVQQAHFYRELADAGQSPSDIADELAVPLAQVNAFLRAEMLHRMALALDHDEEHRKTLEDPRYPLTSLERVMESAPGRKLLGIEFVEGGIRGVVHPERFAVVLKRVAIDAAKSGFTRRINDEKAVQKYVQEVENELPATKMKGSFTAGSILGDDEPETPATEEPRQRQTATPKVSKSVIPTGFLCTSQHQKVKDVFAELKLIKISGQNNSAGVMLRVLLDIALWLHIKDRGLEKDALEHCDPKRKRRNHEATWTPTLRELISYAVTQRIFPGMDRAGYKATKFLIDKENSILTIDGFNEITHNAYVTPSDSELRTLWLRAQPVLEIVLAPPAP